MRIRLILSLLAGAALTAALTACGGSDETKQESASASSPTAAAQVQSSSGGDPYDYGSPATAAAAQATAAPTQAAVSAGPQAIEVKTGDFFFEPTTLAAKPGVIVVTLQNASDGNRPHTFVVKGKDGGDIAKTDRIMPGQSGKLEFAIREAGTRVLLQPPRPRRPRPEGHAHRRLAAPIGGPL